jgi:hypothetical protein
MAMTGWTASRTCRRRTETIPLTTTPTPPLSSTASCALYPDYDAADQVVGLTYDAAGNVISDTAGSCVGMGESLPGPISATGDTRSGVTSVTPQ